MVFAGVRSKPALHTANIVVIKFDGTAIKVTQEKEISGQFFKTTSAVP
jgi:hypothetical protein